MKRSLPFSFIKINILKLIIILQVFILIFNCSNYDILPKNGLIPHNKFGEINQIHTQTHTRILKNNILDIQVLEPRIIHLIARNRINVESINQIYSHTKLLGNNWFSINMNEIQNNNNNSQTTHNYFVLYYSQEVPINIQNIFQNATQQVSSILRNVRIPISVLVNWVPQANNILASSGPSYIYLLSSDLTYYPPAIINQKLNLVVNPKFADFTINMNSKFSGWNTDLTSPPLSNQYDLLTTIIHEIMHGIGIIGLLSKSIMTSYPLKYPYIYDKWIVSSSGTQIIYRKSNVFRSGEEIYFRNKENFDIGFNPSTNSLLFNPKFFMSGSTVYHIDESSKNQLMTPYLDKGTRINKIDFEVRSIMYSIGWDVVNCTDYSSNCNSCTKAGCLWCNYQCFNTFKKIENCNLKKDFLTNPDQCPKCFNNQDCDDINDQCVSGICSIESGNCEIININCDDQQNYTDDFCDSTIGCFHYQNPLKSISLNEMCIMSKNIYDKYIYPTKIGTNTLVFEIIIGEDIPIVPQGFFTTNSDQILHRKLEFGWCPNDFEYYSVKKATDILINKTSPALVDISLNYIHLCSLEPLTVQLNNGNGCQSWLFELYLDNITNIITSKGIGLYSFNSCDYIEYSKILLEFLPKIIFRTESNNSYRILSYNQPNGYPMNFIKLIDETSYHSEINGHIYF